MPDVIKILEPKDQDDNIVPHVASNVNQAEAAAEQA